MNKNFIIIALGTNLGDRYANLGQGLTLLKDRINIEKCSDIYESGALLPENAPKEWDRPFYNCVFLGSTNLNVNDLLKFCNDIENKVSGESRNKGGWAPRFLDIDIIAFNDEIINNETLTIPHPKMLERGFVMFPLTDILPEWQHPVTKISAKRALDNIDKLQLHIKKLNVKP